MPSSSYICNSFDWKIQLNSQYIEMTSVFVCSSDKNTCVRISNMIVNFADRCSVLHSLPKIILFWSFQYKNERIRKFAHSRLLNFIIHPSRSMEFRFLHYTISLCRVHLQAFFACASYLFVRQASRFHLLSNHLSSNLAHLSCPLAPTQQLIRLFLCPSSLYLFSSLDREPLMPKEAKPGLKETWRSKQTVETAKLDLQPTVELLTASLCSLQQKRTRMGKSENPVGNIDLQTEILRGSPTFCVNILNLLFEEKEVR